MEKLTKEQIKEISDLVNSGLRCYLNPVTFEFVILQDEDKLDLSDDEDDPWLEDRQKMEEWEDVEEIEGMTSPESCKMMAHFAGSLPEKEPLKDRLFNTLERKSPFRNFKDLVESSDYREEWFAFRANAWLKHTSDQMEAVIHRGEGMWNEKVYGEGEL